jgi:hypothetical protein
MVGRAQMHPFLGRIIIEGQQHYGERHGMSDPERAART